MFQVLTTAKFALFHGQARASRLMLVLGDNTIATRGIVSGPWLNVESCAFVADLLGSVFIIGIFFDGPVLFVQDAHFLIEIGQVLKKLFLALWPAQPDR